METFRKIISFHREDRNTDPNNISPQSILLDFISSSQTLRIWSFNMSIREHLNTDQLQKGKQIDDWWKQVTKGTPISWLVTVLLNDGIMNCLACVEFCNVVCRVFVGAFFIMLIFIVIPHELYYSIELGNVRGG